MKLKMAKQGESHKVAPKEESDDNADLTQINLTLMKKYRSKLIYLSDDYSVLFQWWTLSLRP